VNIIGESEEGVHIQLNYNKTTYILWNELREYFIVSKLRDKFEEEWPTKWNEIRNELPEGPTIPYTLTYSKGLVQEGADLYHLTLADFLLYGISKTTAENLLKEIGRSKTKPLDKVICALGIHDIGEGTSKLLARHFDSLDKLGKASLNELSLIEGLGETRISSIYSWFHSERNWKTVEKLRLGGLDYAFGYQNEPQEKESQIKGKTFMFTGKLTLFTRSQAQSLVEENGGIAGVSVSKTTDYLVVGEKPGSKLAQASLLGIKVIPEEKFLELVSPSKF